MSIIAYLKSEIAKNPAFSVTSKPGKYQEFNFLGRKIEKDSSERFFTHIDENFDGPVPESIAEFVIGFSMIRYIDTVSSRESGVYQCDSAKAVVDRDSIAGKPYIKIHITANKKSDLVVMYQMLRAGTIRPTVSYDAPQGGLTYEQHEAEIALKKQEIKILESKLKALSEKGFVPKAEWTSKLQIAAVCTLILISVIVGVCCFNGFSWIGVLPAVVGITALWTMIGTLHLLFKIGALKLK